MNNTTNFDNGGQDMALRRKGETPVAGRDSGGDSMTCATFALFLANSSNSTFTSLEWDAMNRHAQVCESCKAKLPERTNNAQ